MLKLIISPIICIAVVLGMQVKLTANPSGKCIYSENFDCSTSKLRSDGWILAGKTKLTVIDGKKCLEVANHKRVKILPFMYLKVEPGKRYTISCLIKTENVVQASRGATIFAEWEDKNKQYTPGGTYLMGFKGSSPWTPLKIVSTNIAPESVRYMKLYTALEGKGKAWFRNLVVSEYNGWQKLPLLEPADKTILKISRPSFSWKKINKKCQLILATNKIFTQNRMVFNVGNSNSFLLPEFLSKDKTWYWQVQENTIGANSVYRSDIRSFKIAKNASDWPVLIKPEYKWSDKYKPVLSARVTGSQNIKINVDIDDIPAKNISFQDGILKFIPGKDLTAGIHKIKFLCKNESDEQFTVHNIYSNIKPKNKVSFKKGIISIDDKPFFPIGAYCDLSKSYMDLEFRGLKEAGFNLVHSYVFEGKSSIPKAIKYLNAAEKYNLKVFMGIQRDWVKAQNNAKMTKYISEVMKFPALLAWYLYDEPAYRKVTVAQLKNVYELVKTLDPFHPTYVAFTHLIARKSRLAKEYTGCCDIIGSDPYPIMFKKPFTLVERWTQNCRYFIGEDRPVWTIIEAFEHKYSKLGKYKKEYGPVTSPTYMQMKCECFMALSAGADGIIFFWMPIRYYNIEKDAPTVWAGVAKVVKELKAIKSFMTTPRKYTKFSVKVPKTFRVWARSNMKGETAIAFINPLEKTQSLKIRLPLGVKKLYTGGRIVQLKNNLYKSSFAPYETKVYIIK